MTRNLIGFTPRGFQGALLTMTPANTVSEMSIVEPTVARLQVQILALLLALTIPQIPPHFFALQGLGLSDGGSNNSGDDGGANGASPGGHKGGGGAAAVAGGVGAGGVAASKGCRATEEVVKDASEAGGSASVEEAMLARSAGYARFGVAATGGDVVSKEADLLAIGPIISKTPVTANMTSLEVRTKWLADPEFRAKAIAQVAERDPESLAGLADTSTGGVNSLRSLSTLYDRVDPLIPERDAIAVALEDEQHISHLPLDQSKAEEIKDAFRVRLTTIVNEAVEALPANAVQPTEAQLRAALVKALKPEPKWSYSFDAVSGKLVMKLRLSHGEVSAEQNLYKITRKAIYLTAVGTGVLNKDEVVHLAKTYFAKKPKKVETASERRTSSVAIDNRL